jgi:hypothetical protein
LIALDSRQESKMGHPTRRQTLIKQARQGQPVQRVEVHRVTCERCGQEGIFASPDGSPRPHLCPTHPGEPMHSQIVPTRIDCTD